MAWLSLPPVTHARADLRYLGPLPPRGSTKLKAIRGTTLLNRARLRRVGLVLGSAACVCALATAALPQAQASAAESTVHIAYLSFAVQNSYDAPMLAAAKAAAARQGAVLTVFDANNSPTTQYTQFQDAITAHQYQGIIVQPIFGTGLLGLTRQAVADHVQVADLDQILGPNLGTDRPQVKDLAANVVFVPTEIGQKLGALVAQACASHNPCNIGYMYDIKASALDQAL